MVTVITYFGIGFQSTQPAAHELVQVDNGSEGQTEIGQDGQLGQHDQRLDRTDAHSQESVMKAVYVCTQQDDFTHLYSNSIYGDI